MGKQAASASKTQQGKKNRAELGAAGGDGSKDRASGTLRPRQEPSEVVLLMERRLTGSSDRRRWRARGGGGRGTGDGEAAA